MKRSTEEKIKVKVDAWKHLRAILEAYGKREKTSDILIKDLEQLAKEYEKAVFEECIEEKA